MEPDDIRPLPSRQGVGFVAREPLASPGRYRYEQVGRYHNYHFTAAAHEWPAAFVPPASIVVDGFSPNLNKKLHVGHVRNLAIAASLSKILGRARFVALFGYSLGVMDGAESELAGWFKMAGYSPLEFFDVELSGDKVHTRPGDGEQAGCQVWDGPKGPVIVKRSDGRPTYAMHDLAFAAKVSPDYYLTGAEQKEHFESLGMGRKHLPMGLVLDPSSGKKMKSRDGTALSAREAMDVVKSRLDETSDPDRLAWNILAWNFLHCSREQNVKFDLDKWTRPESQGMYVTYTYARVASARRAGEADGTWNPAPIALGELEVRLLGTAAYLEFYKARAVKEMDPAPLANYSSDLAQELGSVYHNGERMADGSPGLQYAVERALSALGEVMKLLGMYPLESV